MAEKAEKDLNDDDMVMISECVEEYSPHKVRKGARADWQAYARGLLTLKSLGYSTPWALWAFRRTSGLISQNGTSLMRLITQIFIQVGPYRPNTN